MKEIVSDMIQQDKVTHVKVSWEDILTIQERNMSGTVPVHSEHGDTNEQVRVQCHVIILNTIEHFLYSSRTHLLIILHIQVYN